jgi:hypothetical protein
MTGDTKIASGWGLITRKTMTGLKGWKFQPHNHPLHLWKGRGPEIESPMANYVTRYTHIMKPP